jgi:hypothetical protein
MHRSGFHGAHITNYSFTDDELQRGEPPGLPVAGNNALTNDNFTGANLRGLNDTSTVGLDELELDRCKP